VTIYTGDQKFGHYMKVPPCLIFLCSGSRLGRIVVTVSSILGQQWALDYLDNIPDICSSRSHQKDFFTYPNNPHI
jgi:hypothetical protein